MTSKSKSKGNRFEYAIRDLLNRIYHTKEFARTPGSGAIMGRSNFGKRSGLSDAAKDTLSADMICPKWFPYSIEAKNYADKPIYHTMIHSYDATLDGWLGEAICDARNFDKIPLLFFNTTRKGSFVAVPEAIAKHLTLGNHLIYRDWRIISMAAIEVNAKALVDAAARELPDVLTWMTTSQHVAELDAIQLLKTQKPKRKKKDEATDEAS